MFIKSHKFTFQIITYNNCFVDFRLVDVVGFGVGAGANILARYAVRPLKHNIEIHLIKIHHNLKLI